eukprot:TRINITY_DN3418_c1_g1_i1.p1 TRINITY_DN3418_c1_g1~~TRINITY_DN3418_c1_g1_i1.p1  ORF type:complete len:420 (+),score=78.37 TRINITY_DN3418_c1_g1_i1:63-1262(+)
MSLCEPTDPEDISGRLNYLCQMGSAAAVESFINSNNVTNMNMTDHYGSPPLYNAVMKNDNPTLVNLLLKRGATVGMRNEDDETPLYIALFNNHLECAKALIAAGAKIDERNGIYGDFPMHAAVRNNLSTALNLLLSHNANVNCRNTANETPLFLACKHDRKLLAYTLLMNKANKTLSSEGKDCIYIASEKKHRDIVRLLKASGPAELMQVKNTFEKPPRKAVAAGTAKTTWEDREFQNELEQLGIAEDEAARKPRKLPQGQYRKKANKDPKAPKPLFDSDEDDEERYQRLKKEELAASANVQFVKFHDPAGTTFNPTGAAHIQEIHDTRNAFKDLAPTSPSSFPVPPKPGVIDVERPVAPAVVSPKPVKKAPTTKKAPAASTTTKRNRSLGRSKPAAVR